MRIGSRRALLFAGSVLPPFDFDDALTTFTAGMAVRTGALFAGAPIVQGKLDGSGTPDRLSFSRGTQVAGNWYDNFDPNQGTFEILWNPEKDRDGTQTNDEYLFYISSQYFFDYQHDQERFVAKMGTENILVSHTSVAGTTYAIVLRWDVTNKLDGTNYLCLSINNAHDFQATSQPIASNPGAAIYIGSDATPSEPANAIIEGGHFHRRVWYDGTYGIDVGNGDEVAAHYNGGAWADPSEVVNGAWDCVFALPTNATPGALSTGTGNAWSLPHRTGNLLGVNYGFMLDGFGPDQPWCAAYNGASTTMVASDGAAIQDLQDNAVTWEGYFRWDGMGSDASARLFTKSDFSNGYLHWINATDITARVYCATATNAQTAFAHGFTEGKWHHLAIFFNDAGDRKLHIAVDGTWETAGTAGIGAIVSDIGEDLSVWGHSSGSLLGAGGWVRISNNDRYNGTGEVNFTPARTMPADDINTVVLYNFIEGTGTTIDNDAASGAAYDGTLSNGTWEQKWAYEGTPDSLAELSSAEGIFANQGFAPTTSGANAGIYKDITVSAGDDVVIRAIGYSDGTSVPKCILYDQDNGAEIGSLTGANTSTRAAPDVFIFTGEAPGGCTTMRVKLTNTDATASDVTYWAQAEVYDNLIDNPSMEAGAGNPWIPTGWTNNSLDAGDSLSSAGSGGIIHSGVDCIEFAVGASGEGIIQSNIFSTSGLFYSLGGWAYTSGGPVKYELRNDDGKTQAGGNMHGGGGYTLSDGAAWNHTGGIMRASTATGDPYIKAGSGATDVRYADDIYAIALTAVSLTATPASEANSAEGDGLRVDGLDTLTQPIPAGAWLATEGSARWTWTPRHDVADVEKFGVANPIIAKFYYDASNYITVYFVSPTSMLVRADVAGAGGENGTANPAGWFVAGTDYQMQLDYNSYNCKLYVDEVLRITLTYTGGINFGANIPDTTYWGTSQDNRYHSDAVFSAPT